MPNIKFLLIPLIFAATFTSALSFEVVGKNGAVLLHLDHASSLPSNVGQISVNAFHDTHSPYEGDASGFTSIFGMGQNIEVISGTEMKAYGWCFSLDGLVPDTMPDETTVEGQSSTIRWYYAYAHYKNGDWIGQCVEDSPLEL